jgi:hypothetical protein
MYLIKTLDKKYCELAISQGNIRVGTINFYRKIEDETRKDGDEGLGNIIWAGDELTAENFNKIFTPFDKVKLGGGWNIKNKGAKLVGAYPNFNLFTFCFSQVNSPDEIKATSGGKANSYYFISDFPAFVIKLTNEIEKIGKEWIRKCEPDKADQIIQNLKVVDCTYKINYSDDSKARIVTEENVDSFIPKQFVSHDFFIKKCSFSYEQEVRTIWVFLYTDEQGRLQPLPIPHQDVEFVDLELGTLAITKEPTINNYPIKTSPAKPKNV